MPKKLLDMSEEQERIIKQAWNENRESPLPIKEITQKAFPNAKNVDGRSLEGKSVKYYMDKQGMKTTSTTTHDKKIVNLSDDQKEYITNRYGLDKPLEITRELFNNVALTNLSSEFKEVYKFCKSLDQTELEGARSSSNDVTERYKPPKKIEGAIIKVNDYVKGADNKLKLEKINNAQSKELTSLIAYLNAYRFTHQINTYNDSGDRDLFESSFIRYTHDKADLTQEEVDQYIVLCTEVVISANIQRTIQTLQDQINMEVDSGGKIPMPLVEAVNSARTEYNQCVGRQQKLLNDLKVKRSERISKQVKENASILNLVQMWKDEESRKEMIKMANMRREVLKTEMNKLSSMDDVKARIFGLTEEEVLDG
jgi:hypothetical protein